MPFRSLKYSLWMLEWFKDHTIDGDRNVRILFMKTIKDIIPIGNVIDWHSPCWRIFEKSETVKIWYLTRTVRIFFNPNPRIFSSQRTFLVDFPTRLSGEDTTHYRNWRIAIGKLSRRTLLPKLNILNKTTSQNRSSRRDCGRTSQSRNSIFYALIASKFNWPNQNARSNCG